MENKSLENLGCFGVGNTEPRDQVRAIAKKPNLTEDEKTLLRHLLWLSDVRNDKEKRAVIQANLAWAIELLVNFDLRHSYASDKNVMVSANLARDVRDLIEKYSDKIEPWSKAELAKEGD